MSPPLYLIAPLFAFSLTISFLSLTICQLPRLEWTTTGGTSQVWTWIRNLFLITIEQISKGEYYCHGTIQTKIICCLMKEQWVTTLSIVGIGKSGQIVRGDIWTRKSIPQPADPTTTQTLNIWSISIQYMIYVEKNCPGRHMDIWIRKSNPQPADPTTTQTFNFNLCIQQQQW